MAELNPEEMANTLPHPKGYKILVAIPKAESTFGGTILKADVSINNEQITSLVGLVIELGAEAYKDERKFPGKEPWCAPGDFIMMRSYSGVRFKIGDQEYRLINDDSVEAVVPDPRVIGRVL